MHSIFYRIFSGRSYTKAAALILSGAVCGVLLALVLNWIFGSEILVLTVGNLQVEHPSTFAQVVCALLPLLLAALLWSVSWYQMAAVLPVAVCSFLLCFSVITLLCLPGAVGPALVMLLCAGRCVSLMFLCWFVLRLFTQNGQWLYRDLLLAAAFTAAVILLNNWLVQPGLEAVTGFLNT